MINKKTQVALGLVGETEQQAHLEEIKNQQQSEPVANEPEPLIADNSSANLSLTLDSESLPLLSEAISLVSETPDSPELPISASLESQPTASSELLIQTTSVPLSSKKHKTTKIISSSEERKTFEYDTLCNGLLASTGFVSDPFVCNKYLRCNHGVAERFTCASGTLWNSKDKMCTWPALVDCDDREVFTENELVKEEAGDSSSSTEETGSKEVSASSSASASKEISTSKETSKEFSEESSNSQEKPTKSGKNHKNRFSSTKSLLTRKSKNSLKR
jgi:hypothetical protein